MSRPTPHVVGDVRHYLGQRYIAVAAKPYTRADGTETQIIVWESPCADCGEPFLCPAPAAAARFQPNRRCPKHKRPGQRVRERAA